MRPRYGCGCGRQFTTVYARDGHRNREHRFVRPGLTVEDLVLQDLPATRRELADILARRTGRSWTWSGVRRLAKRMLAKGLAVAEIHYVEGRAVELLKPRSSS